MCFLKCARCICVVVHSTTYSDPFLQLFLALMHVQLIARVYHMLPESLTKPDVPHQTMSYYKSKLTVAEMCFFLSQPLASPLHCTALALVCRHLGG